MLKPSIPFVDLRGKTLIDLLRAYPDKAAALVKGGRRSYGFLSDAAAALALPVTDKRSLAWLQRTRNPYLYDIETFAEILQIPGVYTFNIAYEWGCTGGAFRNGEQVSMLRVLDWPFKALGKHTMIVLQSGKAGEFYNITWPGVSGMFTGMAPGRFCAAIHQAPMRRHGLTFAGDWIKNRRDAGGQDGIPPAHLLRQIFEQAEDYERAKNILTHAKLAVPAIFLLTGTKEGQGCVIERTETRAEIIELGASQQLAAANHFHTSLAQEGKGWRPREIDSPGRYQQGCSLHGHDLQPANFEWLRMPIINKYTRLCVTMDAADARLTVQGFEGIVPVTEAFHRLPEKTEA